MTFLFDHDVPDDLGHVVRQLGHRVVMLIEVLARTAGDEAVLAHAAEQRWVLVTCNRDDFIALAGTMVHAGVIVLFRRKTRAAERLAIVRLLESAGETGIVGNVTCA